MEPKQIESTYFVLEDIYTKQTGKKLANQQLSWFDDENSEQSQRSDEDNNEDNKISEVIDMENENKEDVEIKQKEITNEFYRKNCEKKYKDLDNYEHHIDNNYLILLIVLNRHRMINLRTICELKEGYIDLQSRSNKMIVKTTSQQQANKAIQKISDFLDQLSIVKLDIRGEKAAYFANFKKLKEYLRNDKIVLFGTGPRQNHNLFIGGQMKSSQLRHYVQKIKNIRIQQVYLRTIRNTRSYKIIIGQILLMDDIQKQFISYNQINFLEISLKNKKKEIKLSLGMISKKDFTSNDYEDFFMKKLKDYYVLTFCCTTSDIYFEKPKVQNVAFRIATDRKVNKSFMYIIAKKQDFIKKKDEIFNEITKIGERIIGVRFFYYLNPSAYDFSFNRSKHYFFRFPASRPYSITFAAKTKQGHAFNWQDFFKRFIEVIQKQILKFQ